MRKAFPILAVLGADGARRVVDVEPEMGRAPRGAVEPRQPLTFGLLDGNAAGGRLRELFALDMTAATHASSGLST